MARPTPDRVRHPAMKHDGLVRTFPFPQGPLLSPNPKYPSDEIRIVQLSSQNECSLLQLRQPAIQTQPPWAPAAINFRRG